MPRDPSETMKVFPAADLFPMLPEDELQALADDIKTNGQRDPIVIATVDGEDVLVDGRNRLAACRLAGVEPAMRRLNGEDPTAFVVSVNINRRHMTKGQRAMAVAMIYPEPTKLKRKGSSIKNIDHFSPQLLSHARTVLRHTPEVSRQVLAGNKPLSEAYSQAIALSQETESEAAQIERLRQNAPDLAELVDAGKLKAAEAVAACNQREAKARAEEESRRETLIRMSVEAFACVSGYANEKSVANIVERLADDDFKRAFLTRVRLHNYDAAKIVAGSKAMVQLMKLLEGGK